MIQAFEWGKKGGINTGIIVSLFTICAFTTAVIFFFLYREVLSFSHLLGMILIVISVSLFSIENSEKED